MTSAAPNARSVKPDRVDERADEGQRGDEPGGASPDATIKAHMTSGALKTVSPFDVSASRLSTYFIRFLDLLRRSLRVVGQRPLRHLRLALQAGHRRKRARVARGLLGAIVKLLGDVDLDEVALLLFRSAVSLPFLSSVDQLLDARLEPEGVRVGGPRSQLQLDRGQDGDGDHDGQHAAEDDLEKTAAPRKRGGSPQHRRRPASRAASAVGTVPSCNASITVRAGTGSGVDGGCDRAPSGCSLAGRRPRRRR